MLSWLHVVLVLVVLVRIYPKGTVEQLSSNKHVIPQYEGQTKDNFVVEWINNYFPSMT